MMEEDLFSDYQNKTSLLSTVWNQELGKTLLKRFMYSRTLCHDFSFNPLHAIQPCREQEHPKHKYRCYS